MKEGGNSLQEESCASGAGNPLSHLESANSLFGVLSSLGFPTTPGGEKPLKMKDTSFCQYGCGKAYSNWSWKNNCDMDCSVEQLMLVK